MVQIERVQHSYAVTASCGRISNLYKTEHDARCALRRMIRTGAIELLPRGCSELDARDELRAARQQVISDARALHARYGALSLDRVTSPAEYIAAGNVAAHARGWPIAACDALRDAAFCVFGDEAALAQVYGGA